MILSELTLALIDFFFKFIDTKTDVLKISSYKINPFVVRFCSIL